MTEVTETTVAGKEVRQLLLTRIGRVLDRMRPESLRDALSETDFGVLYSLAKSDLLSETEQGPLAQARLRGLKYREELIQRAGGTLSAADVASILGITTAAVRKRIAKGQLLAMATDGGYQIPAIQLCGDGVIPDLARVLSTLQIEDAWMCLDWLLSTEPRLDERVPLDMLTAGEDLEAVLEAAELVGEHGAQ